MPRREHRPVAAALRDIDPDRRHRYPRAALGPPPLLRRPDPRRRDRLPLIVLAPGEEIAIEELRPQRPRQILQPLPVVGVGEEGIVVEPARDEAVGQRPVALAIAGRLLRPRDPFEPLAP